MSDRPERYHPLDALRAAMMLLGLVLHSAASYTRTPLGDAWPYHDPQTNVAFDLIVFFIHLFRMPLFFVVAGFFAALLYYRDGPARFVRNRARRVLLPLAIFWPTIVPLGGLGFVFAVRRLGGDLPLMPLPNEPLIRQPLLGHLWFLYYLLLFYASALVIVPLAARVPAGVWHRVHLVFRGIAARTWGAILLGGVTMVMLLPMEAAGLDTSAAVFPPLRILAAYGVFFAFGWMLYRSLELLQSIGAGWRSAMFGGIAASVAYLHVAVAQPFTDARTFHVTAIAFAGLSIWLLIFGITGLFVRFLDKPRPLVRYVSDASYWMYLVHVAPVIWLNGLLASSSAPTVVKFAMVLGGTTLLTIVTYDRFVRSTALGALLNGRRYPRGLPAGSGQPESLISNR
jgi:glucan biosynthesis protein C